MNVKRTGHRWVLDWRENGKRKRRHFTREDQARRALRELQARTRHTPPPKIRRDWQQAITTYSATRAGCSPKHYGQTKRVLQQLARKAATVPLQTLEAHHLADYRQSEQHYKANTRMGHETVVRGFLHWCWKNAYTNTPTNELFRRTPIAQELRTVTTNTANLEAILRAAAAQRHEPLCRFLVMLCREAGCRLTEAMKAQARDYDRENRTLTIRSGKNHPARVNPVNPALAAYLDMTITAATAPETPIHAAATGKNHSTKNAGWAWLRAVRAARVPHTTIHDLRRTWATELAEHAPLPLLMELAGWKAARTAIHYLMNQGAQAKRAAVARAWNARQHADPDTLHRKELLQ